MTPVYNVCIQRKQHQTQVRVWVLSEFQRTLWQAINVNSILLLHPNGEHYMVSDWQDLLNHVHLFAGDNIGMVYQ